jgi:DNA-directed RNA polymerase subunit RPC12/RpoP
VNDSTSTGRMRLAISRIVPLVVLVAMVLLLVIVGTPMLVWITLVVVGIALTILVTWHAHRTAYTCSVCGKVFAISAWIDFISPHLPGSKLLRCPHCRAVGWCRAETTRLSKRDVQV